MYRCRHEKTFIPVFHLYVSINRNPLFLYPVIIIISKESYIYIFYEDKDFNKRTGWHSRPVSIKWNLSGLDKYDKEILKKSMSHNK